MKATIIVREKVVLSPAEIVEMVVWQVPTPVPPSLHDYKYRLVYIVNGKRELGYDNERGKGDHRHIGDREEPILFRGIRQLLDRFADEVEAMSAQRRTP